MKKFEVVISGEHEEEIGHAILTGIYEAVQKHGYIDVSVTADTVRDVTKGQLYVPEFLQPYQRGELERKKKALGG